MSMLTFNSIDVETANADHASICQIGIVHIRDGQIADQWQTLVNPEDKFDIGNISIHGITENTVKDSPLLPEIRDELDYRLRGTILVSHTPFDRTAFEQVMLKYELEQLQVNWLDSAMIARRAWPERFGKRGYNLKNVANYLNISFNHHDALEDARAGAEIVLHACKATGIDMNGWLRQFKRTNRSSLSRSKKLVRRVAKAPPFYFFSPRGPVKRDGNEEGPLFGQTILFTGQLSISRDQAAEKAAKVGCNVVDTATKKVTILILGTHDLRTLKGHKKSSKHRKVEGYIAKGKEIKILSEADFYNLIDVET